MLCPICQRIYCAHTPAQRRQTIQEIVEIFHQDTQHKLPPKVKLTIESEEEPPDAEVLAPQQAEA